MPIEKGKRMKDWHCSICGRVYARRNTTAREVFNKWWKHTKKFHLRIYYEKKRQQVRKMLQTKRKRGIIK